MARFAFQGIYQTNQQLPDGSVVLVNPGDVLDLPFTDPGPLWAPSKSKATSAPVASTSTPDEEIKP